MSYLTTLPQAFPWALDVPADEIDKYTSFLNSQDQLSSYAVTTDAKEGHVRLWLSRVSQVKVWKEFNIRS